MDVIKREMAAQLAYRAAAADLLCAARELLDAAQRVAIAAQMWDPAGDRTDPGVMAMVESTEMVLAAACASSLGVRGLFIGAIEASAPPAPAAAPDTAAAPVAASATP